MVMSCKAGEGFYRSAEPSSKQVNREDKSLVTNLHIDVSRELLISQPVEQEAAQLQRLVSVDKGWRGRGEGKV
jgi:hypothetical protein